MLAEIENLIASYDVQNGKLEGGQASERRLSDLSGFFADTTAFNAALQQEDSLLYKVEALAPASGSGDLHYGLGTLYPGKVGDEYFLTKGHYHEAREMAEVYIGFGGDGYMLLEDEQSGESRLVPLGAKRIVYVPGYTAHRTINTGSEPLVYLGVYPAHAGHDYGSIAERNFKKVLVEQDGKPVLLEREDYLK